jgi:hypothetical protein
MSVEEDGTTTYPINRQYGLFLLNPKPPALMPPSFQLGLDCFGCRPINDPIKILGALPRKNRLRA